MSRTTQEFGVLKEPSMLVSIVVILWLSFGALCGLMIEVFWLPLRIGAVPAPFTIIVAFVINWCVLCVARRWFDSLMVAAIPIWLWFLAYFVIAFAGPSVGLVLVMGTIFSLLLAIAGLLPVVIAAVSRSVIPSDD